MKMSETKNNVEFFNTKNHVMVLQHDLSTENLDQEDVFFGFI